MNGLIQLFTAGLNKVFARRIGAVRLMELWSPMIWTRLLWNKKVSRQCKHGGTRSVPYDLTRQYGSSAPSFYAERE